MRATPECGGRAKADNIVERVLGALQMVSEPDPDRCVSEDAELSKGGWMLRPTSVVKGTKSSLYGEMDNLHLWTRFGRTRVKTNRARRNPCGRCDVAATA